MRIDELDTPAVIIDLDMLEANIVRLQTYLDEHHIANRPHIKTHKIPAIAHKQLQAGAIGVTCQKLGEAEVMAQAGVGDIFLPYNIIGASKLERLMELARTTHLSVTADSPQVVRGLSSASQKAGLTLDVLVECDTGGQRCGVQSPASAADLARLIASAPHLRFGGLMTYPSDPRFDDFVRATRDLLAGDDLRVERVSGGGTPRVWQAHQTRELTEYRAGEYVYGNRRQVQVGSMRVEDCAMQVICTVVSRPTAERGILDGGSKTLTSDPFPDGGHGLILEYPEANIYALSEEHGHVDFAKSAHRPEIGERVTVIPNHCCTVTNLFDEVYGVREGEVEVVWPIEARGLVR
jgi:D-serine deaminase-like pyridoxal phosphate-dependent protein